MLVHVNSIKWPQIKEASEKAFNCRNEVAAWKSNVGRKQTWLLWVYRNKILLKTPWQKAGSIARTKFESVKQFHVLFYVL